MVFLDAVLFLWQIKVSGGVVVQTDYVLIIGDVCVGSLTLNLSWGPSAAWPSANYITLFENAGGSGKA